MGVLKILAASQQEAAPILDPALVTVGEDAGSGVGLVSA